VTILLQGLMAAATGLAVYAALLQACLWHRLVSTAEHQPGQQVEEPTWQWHDLLHVGHQLLLQLKVQHLLQVEVRAISVSTPCTDETQATRSVAEL